MLAEDYPVLIQGLLCANAKRTYVDVQEDVGEGYCDSKSQQIAANIRCLR
jgi:hypothetical protein